MREFPGILGEIADVAGTKVAILLADRVGGRRVRIPRRMQDASWLVEIVGESAAAKIVDHFAVTDADGRLYGAGRIIVPLGPAQLMVQARKVATDALAGGASVSEAARQSGLHVRTIWRLKAHLHQRRPSAQRDLFDDD